MNSKHVLYTKDKKVKVTFRCDDTMSSWLTDRSSTLGLSPSAFVRQSLYQQMYAEKTLGDMITGRVKVASTETAANHADN